MSAMCAATGRLLRVIFREQRGAVVGPDLSPPAPRCLKGLLQIAHGARSIEQEARKRVLNLPRPRKDAWHAMPTRLLGLYLTASFALWSECCLF